MVDYANFLLEKPAFEVQFYEHHRSGKTTKVFTDCAKLMCRDYSVGARPKCFSDM